MASALPRASARKIGEYTVGVLVQCNYGVRPNLRIAGVPVGKEIPEAPRLCVVFVRGSGRGSIIVVVATDAPLLAHQLKRLAHRVSLGLGRDGSLSGNGSGDIFIAFSTANCGAAAADRVVDLKMLPNEKIDPIFAATVQATEEAIVNAMVAADNHDRHRKSQSHRTAARPAACRPEKIQSAEPIRRQEPHSCAIE